MSPGEEYTCIVVNGGDKWRRVSNVCSVIKVIMAFVWGK